MTTLKNTLRDSNNGLDYSDVPVYYEPFSYAKENDEVDLSQNVVETFIDRIEVFNDERVKIRFTFEDALNSYEEK